MDKTESIEPGGLGTLDQTDDDETLKSQKREKSGYTEKIDGAEGLSLGISGSQSQTVPSKPEKGAQTIVRDRVTADKTLLAYGKDDIRQKLKDNAADIPEVDMEELEQDYLSSLIKSPFPNRTEEDQVKINRNFLRDAEPFNINRLVEELKNTPKELLTGFSSLDRWIRIPQHKITMIASRPGHGKTAFMLNMLLNMSHIYKEKHFLYYSYGEPRRNIEIKLINMSGQVPFKDLEGTTSNFERWKHIFQHMDIADIKARADKDEEYRGLNHFLEVSPRIHVIDSNYNIPDLLDSIEAFQRTLTVGGVFIDYLQAIRADREQLSMPRSQQLYDITHQLRELGNDTPFPVMVGVQFKAGEANIPEYDGLSTAFLEEVGDPEQVASLIIGLQNYSKSMFIGSNYNSNFKSHFYAKPFKKAEKMPDTFRDKHANTVFLAKVLANQGRPEPEVELIYNKWLMKVSHLEEGKQMAESIKKETAK